MAKSKLKSALDAHRGVDYQQVLEKKKQKRAKRSKALKEAKKQPEEDGDALEEEEDEGGVLIDQDAVGTEIDGEEVKKIQAELKALLGNKKKLEEIDSGSDVSDDYQVDDEEDEADWESAAEDVEGEDDDEDEDGSSDGEDAGVDLSRLVDSESDESDDEDEEMITKPTANGKSKPPDGTVEDDEEEEEDEVEDEDIPLSDIESLASEDRGDVIPHQRLTINNKAALNKALERIALPLSTLPFSAHQAVTSQTNTANSIPDIDDDLKRELAFYAQSLEAVKQARKLLTKEGVPFSRPSDYFAEMVKSDEHMGRVKDKLRDEAAGKKAAAEARRQRDLKKFGKQVQVAKLQERAKEKRETLDRINVLKRKRAGAMPTNETEGDLFDVELEDSATAARNDREDRKKRSASGSTRKGDPGAKRQKRDEKFGYGGKKRFSKSGDAQSTSDMRSYPGKNMKKPFKSRPGKARRAQARL